PTKKTSEFSEWLLKSAEMNRSNKMNNIENFESKIGNKKDEFKRSCYRSDICLTEGKGTQIRGQPELNLLELKMQLYSQVFDPGGISVLL
ncbi:22409_t:CDS:2, partial [Gigaspora rosea]